MSTISRATSKPSGKYQHVGAVIRNGPSVLHSVQLTANQVAARRNEIFDRIDARNLYKFLVAIEHPAEESIDAAHDFNGAGGPRIVTVDSSASDQNPVATKPAILILDVRPATEYASWRLVESLSMPRVDYITRDKAPVELFHAKRNGTPIVIVGFDEGDKSMSEVASKMVQTGFTNVAILTGGLRSMAESYPLALEGPDCMAMADTIAAQVSPHKSKTLFAGTGSARDGDFGSGGGSARGRSGVGGGYSGASVMTSTGRGRAGSADRSTAYAGSVAGGSRFPSSPTHGSPGSDGSHGNAYRSSSASRAGGASPIKGPAFGSVAPTVATAMTGRGTLGGAMAVSALASKQPRPTFGTSDRFAGRKW